MLPFSISTNFLLPYDEVQSNFARYSAKKRLSAGDSIGKRQMGLLGAIKKPTSHFLWHVRPGVQQEKKLLAKHYDMRW